MNGGCLSLGFGGSSEGCDLRMRSCIYNTVSDEGKGKTC